MEKIREGYIIDYNNRQIMWSLVIKMAPVNHMHAHTLLCNVAFSPHSI